MENNDNNGIKLEEAQKEKIIPKPLIDSNNYTKYYSNGAGNTVYLDGHDLDCGDNNFIKNFLLQQDKEEKKYRYKFLCNSTREEGFSNSQENYTNAQIKAFKKVNKNTLPNDDGQGNVAFLDRHKVQCNGLISQFRLERNKNDKGVLNQYSYKYKCLEADNKHKMIHDKLKVTSKVTPTKNTMDLVSKEINCYDQNDLDKGLVNFQYKNVGGKAYYEYTCGKIIPKTKEDLKKEKDAIAAKIKKDAAAEKIKKEKDAIAAKKKKEEDAAAEKIKKEKEAVPTKPGCFVYSNDTCPNQGFNTQGKWHHDTWGETNKNSHIDEASCRKRKIDYDNWCGGKKDFVYKWNKPSNKTLVDFANKHPPIGTGPYLHNATGITYQVSSSWDGGKNNHFTPWLDSKQGWSSGANNKKQWINMKFKKKFVKNIVIQGRVNGDHGQYLKKYDLYYKNKHNKWIIKGRKVTDTKNNTKKIKPVNAYTNEIQLNIIGWNKHITFRVGVEFSEKPPKSFNLLKDGQRIRFATAHKDKYIRGFEDGKVGWGGAGKEEIFICKKITNKDREGKWAFYNPSHKKFLRANDKNGMDLSLTKKDFNDFPASWGWEAFSVVDAGDGRIGLLTHSNGWVGITDTGGSYQGQHHKDIEKEKWMTWERFILSNAGGNTQQCIGPMC